MQQIYAVWTYAVQTHSIFKNVGYESYHSIVVLGVHLNRLLNETLSMFQT